MNKKKLLLPYIKIVINKNKNKKRKKLKNNFSKVLIILYLMFFPFNKIEIRLIMIYLT